MSLNNLLNFFTYLDTTVFHFINQNLKNNFFDIVMPIITTADYWRLPLLTGFLALAVFGRKKGVETFLICLITLFLSDGMTNYVLKPLFGRPRPFVVLEGVNQLVSAGGYSFPSAHASNMTAMAVVISYIWQRYWVAILGFGIACVVAFSRIYVGVHYPMDAFFGIVVGVFCAWLGFQAFALFKKLKKRTKDTGENRG